MKTYSSVLLQIHFIFVIVAAFAVENASAQERIKVVSPAARSTVSRIENVSGTIDGKGIPFIFVRPIEASLPKKSASKNAVQKNVIGSDRVALTSASSKALTAVAVKNPWWVQKNCQLDPNGGFVGQVHFGNSLTPDKTKFEMLCVLVSNLNHAKKLREMYSIDEVPWNIGPRSRTLIFKLDKNKVPSPTNSFVIYPTDADLVGRRATLVGVIPKYGLPVVFVKAVDENTWWVQDIIKPDKKGGFKCDLYFGNESTPNQSKFQIAVAIVEDQLAQNLRKGAAMAKLPRDHLGLQTVAVQLEREITFRNASNQRISK